MKDVGGTATYLILSVSRTSQGRLLWVWCGPLLSLCISVAVSSCVNWLLEAWSTGPFIQHQVKWQGKCEVARRQTGTSSHVLPWKARNAPLLLALACGTGPCFLKQVGQRNDGTGVSVFWTRLSKGMY